MAVREEGIALRLIAETQSLREGKREIQQWSKEVNQLSRRIKTGMGTKEDFSNLRQYQERASKGFTELQTKIGQYSRERETYIKRMTEAPGTALGREARIRERQISQAIRLMERRQEALGGVGGAAEAGAAGAPGIGARGAGAAGKAFRFARGIPGIGAALTAGGAFMVVRSLVNEYKELEITSTNIALNFAQSGESLEGMTRGMKNVGRAAGFTQRESVAAAGAMMMAGGRAMMAGGDAEAIMQVARTRGIDPSQLGGLTGVMMRTGAYKPGQAKEFLARMEGRRLMTGANPLALQQYMQSVLPFLQAEGRFKPFVGSSEEAFARLQFQMVAQNPEDEEFVRRNMLGVATGLSQAIRTPQGPAADFFVKRALGLGQPGVSFFDVMKRQEQGLTTENLPAILGRARTMSGGRRDVFAMTMRSLTGGQINLTMAEKMFDMDAKTDTKKMATTLGFRSLEEFKEKLAATPADSLFKISQNMERVRLSLGEDFATLIIPLQEKMAGLLVELVEHLTGRRVGATFKLAGQEFTSIEELRGMSARELRTRMMGGLHVPPEVFAEAVEREGGMPTGPITLEQERKRLLRGASLLGQTREDFGINKK